MADKPSGKAVNSDGFSQYIEKSGQVRSAAEIGVTAGRWPTADQMGEAIKKTGAADVGRTSMQFLDPAYFDPLLFFIQHRDRKELNFRLRHAYEYEPIVGNLIDLHRTMPLSDYSLNCKDKSVERYFQEFADRVELLPTSSYILGEYFLLGEAVIWKVWDDFNKTWKEITMLPPEKVELRKTFLTKEPIILLHVDSELKKLVNSSDELDQAIVKQLDPLLVEKIKTQDRIVLPPHQVDHFANKTSLTDLRGTSILKRGLYALLLKYKVRLLHNTYLDRAAFPLKLFKLGHPESKWVPSRSHFEALRNMLAAAANDPDFNIIYHYGLQVEYHGVKDKWEDLIKHYDWCDKELMIALFANEALLQSKGVTYSNANISVRVLMSRYQTIRGYLELLWRNKIFTPIAMAREYWVKDSTGSMSNNPTKQKDGKFYYLDVPRFKWAKLNLLDDTAQKQFLMRLREKVEIPHKTIAETFGLDEQELVAQLKNEEATPVDPIWIETRKKAAAQPSVMSQILQGQKSKEWVLEKSTPEDEAKKKQLKDKVDTAPGGADGPTGAPAAGAPAPGGAPKPAGPAGAPPMPGKPAESPAAGPAPGVTTPPL